MHRFKIFLKIREPSISKNFTFKICLIFVWRRFQSLHFLKFDNSNERKFFRLFRLKVDINLKRCEQSFPTHGGRFNLLVIFGEHFRLKFDQDICTIVLLVHQRYYSNSYRKSSFYIVNYVCPVCLVKSKLRCFCAQLLLLVQQQRLRGPNVSFC